MDSKYEIITYWSKEDSAVIAEVPELPGGMADGKSYLEALQNVQIIINDWLETAKLMGELYRCLKES